MAFRNTWFSRQVLLLAWSVFWWIPEKCLEGTWKVQLERGVVYVYPGGGQAFWAKVT